MRTSHGIWQVREGIIVTLKDTTGKLSRGEIAPIPWFGSETITEAISFCKQQGDTINRGTINNIPDRLPACQFALESALENLEQPTKEISLESLNYCYLLPTGKAALNLDFTSYKRTSPPTFKWKIGVAETTTEIELLQQLITRLPNNSRLRLDANGGLTLKQAQRWLEFAQKQLQIEFIEQPLPPSQFTEMMALQRDFSTALALDESVTNIRQLIACYEKGWRGVFVVKAAIAGYPSLLRQFCQQQDLDLVFSSVFSTDIGRRSALKLALELGNRDRAVGFGVSQFLTN